jgi:enoyl-[acyl-carrier protein] reductase II
MQENKVCQLFNIKYPVIQAGMVWCSGWKLASAVSNAGGLGLIGSGSMSPDLLREHIRKCKASTGKPFGVNIPLLYPHTEENIKVILEEGVKIVFTSAGNPKTYTAMLQDNGIKVVHVIANEKFAIKGLDAGVDGLVAEGFEAGGHNGIEENTSMVLIPLIRKLTDKPLIAAGGIATGRGMLAAMALGADGVQIGSRFAISTESSAHENFKARVVDAGDGETMLTFKKLVPVRMIKNKLYEDIKAAEDRCASPEELDQIHGKGKSRLGIFEGDLENGELEIGQNAALINDIKPAGEILQEIIADYHEALELLYSNEY